MKIIIFLASCLFWNITYSQEYQISGFLIDSNHIALDHASVILLNPIDSAMIEFSQTRRDGSFDIIVPGPGKYLIQFSFIGFQNHWHSVEINSSEFISNIGTIALKSKNYVLPSAEVKAEHSPIRFGKDTVEYNASAFKTQPGDVVEDLLKKLPGIEVERDGSVKAYGENVENVLVDGKEFFGKDTRIATKNLEADAVDKVQVFDKKSDEAAFTGVEDGRDEKTINLQLKEDKKQGYFGNVSAGAGNEDRYVAKMNINRFTPSSRISLIGSANNVNEQGFSIQEYIDFMGGIGSFMSGGGGRIQIELNNNTGLPIQGSGQIPGIQNSIAAGLNYSKDLSDKSELNTSYFHNQFDNSLLQNTFRKNLSDSSIFNTNEDLEQNSKNNNHSINVHLKHKSDSSQHFSFRLNGSLGTSVLSSYSNTSSTLLSTALLNKSLSDYQSDVNQHQFRSSLSWMKRIGKPGRSLVSRISGTLSKNHNLGLLNSLNTYFIPTNAIDSIHQKQDLQNENSFYEFNLSYTEPIGRKKYMEFSILHSRNKNDSDHDYFDLQDDRSEIKNEFLSKLYESNYLVNSAGLSFTMNSKKFHATGGLKYQQSALKGKILQTPLSTISETYHRLLPALFGEYEFATAHHLNLQYETRLREPGIKQLQPAVNNTDPLNIYTGNPKLKPEFVHELNASYFLYDAFYFTSLFANLNGSITQDKITDLVQIDSSFRRLIQPVNVPTEKSLRAGFDFSTPIRKLKINGRIKTSAGISQGILYLNGVENQINRIRTQLNLSIDNRNKDRLDILLGWKISNQKIKYSKDQINNQNYGEQSLYTDITFQVTGKLSFKSFFESKTYNSSLFNEQLHIPLWEFSISYLMLKDSKLKLQLKFFDILNKSQGIQRTSRLNYIEEQHTNVLGRYCLLQLNYSLRGFQTKKSGLEIKIEN